MSKKISVWALFLTMIVLALGCSKTTEKKIKLVSKFYLETIENDSLNSKIAISNNFLLIKENTFYHSKKEIASSKTTMLKKLQRIKTNDKFDYLESKFKLKNCSIDSLIFSIGNVTLNIQKKLGQNKVLNVFKKAEDGNIYHLYRKESKQDLVYLDIYNKDLIESYTFPAKKVNYSFFIKDINGDMREEFFLVEWDYGYWGNTYRVNIYQFN